jgi:hypothetical protein
MPPQQRNRLLDLVDNLLDFRAHGCSDKGFLALPPADVSAAQAARNGGVQARCGEPPSPQ